VATAELAAIDAAARAHDCGQTLAAPCRKCQASLLRIAQIIEEA
jgi:hypothetical protein